MLGSVWSMFGVCLGYVWTMFGNRLKHLWEHIWGMCGACLASCLVHLWGMFVNYLVHVWSIVRIAWGMLWTYSMNRNITDKWINWIYQTTRIPFALFTATEHIILTTFGIFFGLIICHRYATTPNINGITNHKRILIPNKYISFSKINCLSANSTAAPK